MNLIQIDWNPSRRQLRQFGAISVVALPLVGWALTRPGGLLTTWLSNGAAVELPGRWNVVAALATVGLALAALAFLAPRVVKPLFVGLSLVTAPIGLVVSELVVLAVYLLAITPIALVMRLAGRDALGRRLDRPAKSYWQCPPQPPDATSYYRQF